MTRTTKKAAAKLNTAIAGAVKRFAPPESLTVDEWADKHRRLSPESSAEAGPWRTKRTPYLEEPMRAFTDPKVHKIVMVAASQVGKSELELNIIGYIIDQDPGSILYVHPTIDDARKFSRLRVAPMIRDSKPLKAKVHDVKAKDSGNTILQKSFPGGMLTLTGSNSASALASTPARYIIGDERDRWAWEKLPGHNRNEALDCRDYANAGLKIINPDMDAIERRLQGLEEKPKAPQQRRQRQRHNRADAFDDW